MFHPEPVGWALRDYGRYGLEWVVAFVARHRDARPPLSVRAALKNIA